MLGDISPVRAKGLPLTRWHCSNLAQLLLGVLDLGVGTRGTRIEAPVETLARGANADAYLRARTATGWGTPYLKIVVLTVFAPQDAGDEPPPCLWHEAVRAALCEHRRRGARGGVRGDLGKWCCNVRAGGESLISS